MDYKERRDAWLKSEYVSEEQKTYIRGSSQDEQKEMFSGDLEFGTGGMRALIGPGSARFNTLTVRRATIGVAKYLLGKYGPAAARERGFAISFDNRHFSKEFRDTAAKVLTDMGFTVYTFHDPHPTPELSYTVRLNNCIGGLMLTASHNPREYHGYKVYDEKGCQCVYESVDQLIEVINSLPDELAVNYNLVREDRIGKVVFLDETGDYDKAYVAKEISTSLYLGHYQGERLTKIVFSPECGCDSKVGPMTLFGAGYDVTTVPGQDFFDPDFTGTKNPNPETDGAYEGAIRTLNKLNAEGKRYNLILVTDPDADRCGIAFVNKDGQIQRFTGNQTGALLIDFVLKTLTDRNALPEGAVVCNTFVTGGQGAKAAEYYGAEVKTTATGFKYIGNMADRLVEEGKTYVFGYEESYGYLLKDFVRDKDSLQSILYIADMCEYYLRQGKTLDIAYEELCQRLGRYYNDQVSFYFYGSDSHAKMKDQITKLRKNPPSRLGDDNVVTMVDYQERTVTDFAGKVRYPLQAPDVDVNDCLRFNFEDGSFVAVRPSGTEPKVKVYVEVIGKNDADAKVVMDKRVATLKKRLGL